MEWYEFGPHSSLFLPLIAQTLISCIFFPVTLTWNFCTSLWSPPSMSSSCRPSRQLWHLPSLSNCATPSKPNQNQTQSLFQPACSLHGVPYTQNWCTIVSFPVLLLLQGGGAPPSLAVHPWAGPAPCCYITPAAPHKASECQGKHRALRNAFCILQKR